MKSVQITYDAKVKIGTSYERGEACTQLDFLDDKVVESLIADLNALALVRSASDAYLYEHAARTNLHSDFNQDDSGRC